MRRVLGGLVLSLALVGTPAGACEEDIGLEAIHAYLVYAYSGTLSDDLLARADRFDGWNTPIGGGDAAEAADDVLVIVSVASTGQVFVDDRLEIWAVEDEGGEELARRSFSSLLTSEDGQGAAALYLPDSTCEGSVTIHASFRGEEKTANLQLHCGE
ncbi:hypothetical protein [Parerythrobacter lacustris]|uniref:Lipoprotein n=1 Tax=Parerythrobacter lacustris TaxID=2969984 RepID=A0ABT1XPP5_9SPHN|nr:hypothetical protein [Parerythrobacter lacustris]MCR2833634.1 hypothetical protein [Parerythrobacter lacustris]